MAEEKQILQCHSRGDKRFSALYAEVTIKGNEEINFEQFKKILLGQIKPIYYLSS